jgi:hypothetical protein
MQKIDVTEVFRKLREFQRRSSENFARFHKDLGLPLTLEHTESSEAFEVAIQSAAEIRLRELAGDASVQPVIECEFTNMAVDATWFYEDLNLMTGLQSCPSGIRNAQPSNCRFEALYDLDHRIPRAFEYVQIGVLDASGGETNMCLYVPFDQVRFYLQKN